MSEEFHNEEEVRQRHRRRIEEMQRSKRRQMLFRRCVSRYIPATAGLLIMSVLVFGTIKNFHNIEERQGASRKQGSEGEKEEEIIWREDTPGSVQHSALGAEENPGEIGLSGEDGEDKPVPDREKKDLEKGDALEGNTLNGGEREKYSASKTPDTKQVGDEIVSEYAIFIDQDSQEVLAEKGGFTIINPASMTKILTVLVAAEHIKEEDLDDTIIITPEITDYGFIHKCSAAGFAKGEEVSIRDLFYGTILPSGADAAVGLATYVAGSQEDFVKLMNQKLEDLGLSDTAHVTNCVGLYDEDHYCSVYDMAVILRAALANDYCREVLSAHTYTTSKTEQHPEGITISNWFLRRIEDKDTGGEVVCGKTGYVVQSDHCAASYYESADGKRYICVTAGASSPWRCIYDQVELYRNFR